MQELCGWRPNPKEVERICQSLPVPVFDTPEPENKDVFLNVIHDRIAGYKLGEDIQLIGDCTSFGWAHLVDVRECVEIDQQLKSIAEQHGQDSDTFKAAEAKLIEEYQRTCTEAIYGLSRVGIGGERNNYEDGSVGAWCAKAVNLKGTLSRPLLASLGLKPDYDPKRAKDWGAKGLPDSLEPQAFKHTVQTTSLVRNFKEAAWHIQNGRPVAVCSNVGFENGGNGRTIRDEDGFVKPRGSWNHCMCFVAVRMGRRPGLGLLQQWPYSCTSGPKGFETDPDHNFWWVDADVATKMLSQEDSFTGEGVNGYPIRNMLDWRW